MILFPTFVTILVASAIPILGYSRSDRRITSLDKRQESNADQMVQNILEWLQGSYTQNSRRIRQGTFRGYLPPPNPRPFEPVYPPAGFSPEPPFPFPTSPVTGGVTGPGPTADDDDGLIPPDQSTGSRTTTGGVTTTVVPDGRTLPTEAATSTISTVPTTQGPGAFPTHPAGSDTTTTLSPEGTHGVTSTTQAGSTTLPPEPTPLYTSPEGTTQRGSTTVGPTTTLQPGVTEVTTPSHTAAPTESVPTQTAEHPTPTIDAGHTTPSATTLASGSTPIPGSSHGPDSTIVPDSTTVSGSTLGPGSTPAAPETTPGSTPEATQPSSQTPGYTITAGSTIAPGLDQTAGTTPGSTPSGFTASETGPTTTTISPESNTIPGPGGKSGNTTDVDDEHPPHIHAIDVQCSKDMMTINIEFNREFNGVIYSKGFYSNPDCRYVAENSGQTTYRFTVSLDKCGTEFVNAFDTQNQSYLENVLVLQNEAGIQEIWDTVRSVRCLWEGNLKDTLSVAFSIGMLSQEIITFSGDTAMAKLDVVLGRGPFGEPANGLVKIGEQMTLVVSVSGDPGFDLQVKDCRAVDADSRNSVALTDEEGCILKPKVFGSFQKTRDTGTTGASIIAYAYFNAFKFPDEMDLMIECNIELCKNNCEICTKVGQPQEPGKRRKREAGNGTVTGDWVTMGKLVRVILPEDLNQKTALEVSSREHVCMTIQGFVFATAVLVSLLIITSFTSVCLWYKRKETLHLKY